MDDRAVQTYLEDVAEDARVERTMLWRGLLAAAVTLLMAAGVVAWTVFGG